MKPETVLVPVDGSEFSLRAVPVGLWLSAMLDAEVRLLSTVETAEEVAEREAQLTDHGKAEVVVDRDPAGEIHEALKRLAPAVACMASHGRGRSAALVGSVATEVVARGHDPLVLVGPLVDGTCAGRGVLACVDDTPPSRALLPVARAWAQMLGQRLTVVTAAEPVPPPLDDRPTRRRFGPDGDVEAFLDELVGPLREEGVAVDARVIYDPISPAEGVRSHLRDEPAALVVVSSHARTGLTRLVFGSTAAAIVHHSPSPVLVVPRPDAR